MPPAAADPAFQDSDMAGIAVDSFDLAATLGSGQAFHWRATDDGGFVGLIGDTAVWLRQPSSGRLLLNRGAEDIVRHYLALDHDLPRIVAAFPPGDPVLQDAVAFCPGLRIMRQPAWECLATFITSSLKQVAHIAAISHTLRRRFGRPIEFRGTTLFAYPEPEIIASAGENELRACGLGYRAKFLAATARAVCDGTLDLDFPRRSDVTDDEALAHLCTAPGIGPKIASCTLLFAYERLSAFPVDVWIERVLRQLYFRGSDRVKATTISTFAHRHFGPFRGYAQQFLFHHARLTMKAETASQVGSAPRQSSQVQQKAR